MADTSPDATLAPAPTLIDRTLGNLRTVWRDIASSASSALEAVGGLRGARGEERWREQIRACLEARGGEVSARARAAELGRTYLGLDADGRRRFLILLARDFDVDRAAVDRAVEVFHKAVDPVARGKAERALRHVLEPGRLRLLTQFNGLPEGVKFLVDMRAELLELAAGEPLLAALEADLKSLLKSWFDVGFLELRRITWDSPASLLEKLVRYEAVHEIRSWQDLKDRLDSDRRCFGFFHPRMPDEPLIFVEVALVEGMSASIHALLDEDAPALDPAEADTAVFYSISNAQKGLAGISFGNFLIKRVVDLVADEFPNVRTFATLSPIPGFRRWLDSELAREGDGILAGAEALRLRAVVAEKERPLLAAALARPGWHEDTELEAALKPVLLRLCGRYLVAAKAGQRALDPVAHFHLTNGARVERLNWLADRSGKGLTQSAGMMVNYAYRLANIDSNHESYTGDGKVIASNGIKSLLKPQS
ncbi:MAG TPA: malonyl-CoA decarboxylase [Azospirillaceae bacterium]|nr:malonyl-CoA decarboxylase [Azospirillaceae bacterium]